MSPLSELLTDLAHEEERVAARTHDGPTELRSVLAEARRAGRRRLAATLTASAAAVALAVAGATLLPEPVDPAPAQRDGSTAAPSPAEPSPAEPSPTPTPTAPVDAAPTSGAWGLVAPLPDAPRTAWSVRTTDLMPGADPADPPHLESLGTGGPMSDAFTVAADGTWVVLLADRRRAHIVGLDPATGTRRWSRELGVDAPGQCAGVDTAGHLVCAGLSASGTTALRVVDASDGAVLREVEIGFTSSALGVSGDVAVLHGFGAPDTDQRVGLSTRTGEVLWSAVGQVPGEGVAVYEVTVLGTRAVLAGGNGSGTLVLDAATGEPLDDPGGGEADAIVGLRVADPRSGVRLAHTGSGSLTARDARDGTPLWEHPALTALALTPGTVVARSGDGGLHVLDDRTGAPRWDVPGGPDGAAVGVVASDGTRLVLSHPGADGSLRTLSGVDATTGETVWTSSSAVQGAHVVGDRLLLEDGTGTLTALAP
ncbi:PQQ-binding-like beta-propeller repeat protein [Cellulomonas cellasea]|uniref:Outer membrane protein assembly factor BamB n=1 Tax=Cellulomonas cellasea TaxID=43670 RepID=A0A7W4UG66_9CELL|nr:PQQ-binding-like beta-propeller repeat protein [Cellulomonas cellasea]MBB2923578.1 outer membrane protein assembly factor BamB [Cellulomonas cellasea]